MTSIIFAATLSSGYGEYLLVILFGFWIWMLTACLLREKDTTSKLLWIAVLFFTNIVGALIYFFVRFLPRLRNA